jgi:predicted nucleic acid-binding protein
MHISTAPRHLDARRVLRWLIEQLVPLWISRQVLRECAAVITRPQPYTQPMSGRDAAALLRHLTKAYFVADETSDVTDHLLTLMETVAIGGRQVHDASIAAPADAQRARLRALHVPHRGADAGRRAGTGVRRLNARHK